MISLTDQNFDKEISNSDKPVVVDFWAEWCLPCLVFSPILEKLAEEYKDKFILAKVNLNVAPLIAKKHGIDRIPRVLLFKKGKLINGFIGVRPESLIREWLEKNLKNDSEKIEDVIKEYEKYAKENRFRLNLDRKKVEFLVKGLLENERKYGVRHCPCRRVTGNLEEDKKKICPCFWHRQEIERDGRCLCGLFVK